MPSIKVFKKARDISSELRDLDAKMEAYKELGNAYSIDRNYENSIKCYKKLMIYAWKAKDKSMELEAYSGLSIQYYYLGEVKKCEFLTDRVMKCKLERHDSKIRDLAMNQIAYDLREFEKVNFEKRDIHEWAQEDSIIQTKKKLWWDENANFNGSSDEEEMTPKQKVRELKRWNQLNPKQQE